MFDKILNELKQYKIKFFLLLLTKSFWGRLLPDKIFLKIKYYVKMNKKLNIDHPKTFNEKLNWIKLYDRDPLYIQLVDKYDVKQYVSKIIGDEYIVPTLGVWDSFDDIDFDVLSDKFVLKCTHDSGGLAICTDKSKFDIDIARERITKSLHRNFFYEGREWPYKDVKPRIIAEKYISNNEGEAELSDYKVHCFNGIPKIILLCTERHSTGLKEDFYDLDWNHLEIARPNHGNSGINYNRPNNLELMIELSRKLSRDIPFIRVDFYESEGKLYFGELTFFPSSGMAPFVPDSWDNIMGEWITLPDIK